MDDTDIPPPPSRSSRAAGIVLVITAAVGAILIGGFAVGAVAHHGVADSNVFSNISNGLGLGAGGGGGGAPAQAPNPPQSAPDQGAAQPSTGAAPNASTTSVTLSIGTPPPHVERDVHASYTVPAGDFTNAFGAVSTRAQSLGGYVASSVTAAGPTNVVDQGTIVLKVPSAHLDDMLTGLPSNFQVAGIDFTTVDHTAAYTDLQTRLKLSQTQLSDLQQALAAATNPADMESIRAQIAQVQSDIETLQGQIDAVNETVDMSTVSIDISERGIPAPSTSTASAQLGSAASAGFSNDILLLSWAAFALLSAAPVLVILIAVLAGRRRIARFVRRAFAF